MPSFPVLFNQAYTFPFQNGHALPPCPYGNHFDPIKITLFFSQKHKKANNLSETCEQKKDGKFTVRRLIIKHI